MRQGLVVVGVIARSKYFYFSDLGVALLTSMGVPTSIEWLE